MSVIASIEKDFAEQEEFLKGLGGRIDLSTKEGEIIARILFSVDQNRISSIAHANTLQSMSPDLLAIYLPRPRQP
jgi:hypothetical protein